MDRDFITRNQVVERYLSGRLPLKGATEFERYCHDHPELLDEMGLPERVNAGLRLLEASGKPEPWQEAPRPRWQQPAVTIGLAVAVVALVIALLTATSNSAAKSHRIADLQKQVVDRTLDPATSTRDIRLVPSRSGASNSPAITIGGGDAQLADFRIDESHSPYHVFRVTIDRVEGFQRAPAHCAQQLGARPRHLPADTRGARLARRSAARLLGHDRRAALIRLAAQQPLRHARSVVSGGCLTTERVASQPPAATSSAPPEIPAAQGHNSKA
jgi:hypothetical protein